MRVLLLLLFTLLPLQTWADWSVTPANTWILPYNVVGVTEILRAPSIRASRDFGAFTPEIGYFKATLGDVKFESGMFSFLGSPDALVFEDLKIQLMIGTQISRFQFTSNNTGETDKRRAFGFHAGFSPMLKIGGETYFRTDFYWLNGPGRILQISLGIQIYFGSQKSDSLQQ